jgi:hypothetical protein
MMIKSKYIYKLLTINRYELVYNLNKLVIIYRIFDD